MHFSNKILIENTYIWWEKAPKTMFQAYIHLEFTNFSIFIDNSIAFQQLPILHNVISYQAFILQRWVYFQWIHCYVQTTRIILKLWIGIRHPVCF